VSGAHGHCSALRRRCDEQDNSDGSHSSSGFLTNVKRILTALMSTGGVDDVHLSMLGDTDEFHRSVAARRLLRLLQLLCEDHFTLVI
jgi:hypothetical protein